ncbi:MAG TPA: hypothetical protein VM074_12520 [Solimonas sp.]|nr:hypothetical protein [Solimonas sp.]
MPAARPCLRAAALALLTCSGAAIAASPASGTLNEATPELIYSSGPFAAANASATQTPAAPTCQNPVQPCDDFALTVEISPAFAAAHPRARLHVNTRWPVNNFFAYNLYILDAAGAVIQYQATERDPVTVSIPAAPGLYTLRILPQQGSPDTLSTTVRLIADPTGPEPSGIAPRFVQVQSPTPLGDNTAGEMSIGFNPRTGRVLTLSYLRTLRTTFAENLDPAQPASCDALWEDVSDQFTSQNTNDPILFTDQATGRTFVSQLQGGLPGDSIFAYTDDDGDTWAYGTGTNDGGIDHQTVGGGPYSAGGSAAPMGAYPDATYYCSQSVAAAFCVRSDDGGSTFTAPSVLKTSADCNGFTPNIHGHVRVAPDGTAYVPDRNCGGEQAVIVSEDSGDSWQVRRVAGSVAGDNDSSVGLASDGTAYLCYLDGDGHPHVTVSHDKGLSWGNDRDIGYALGVERAVFPNAIAGDPDRAACAFLGTTTPGNYQSVDFEGIWNVYAATTYDGGDSWHTANPVPDDPVQGVGGICLGGTTCIQNRNLLDFNEITLDDHGRVLYGYNDGCLDDCISTHIPNQLDFFGVIINTAARATILRQSGGRTLLAAGDRPEPAAPGTACLAGTRDATAAHLNWKAPDTGGAAISGYKIYRAAGAGPLGLLQQTGPEPVFDDLTAPAGATLLYQVTALNAQGEGIGSNIVTLADAGGAGGSVPVVAQLSADASRYGGALGWPALLMMFAGGLWRRRRGSLRS